MKHSSEPVILSENFDSVKSAYIFCTGGGRVDEILKRNWGKLDAPYKVIESGHWPMITKPDELAKDMLDLATS
jgi:pimeloyl-ACP methyl ester carboxylesterase